ncbi:MAG TPA: D-alanyl-D-alanine carboxypeptidase family protein [Lachnospiraceae bacterium]|nr:D-alanyl-D-alanine carboxypeptidase family protein [Lachnospiraceae bacterium]
MFFSVRKRKRKSIILLIVMLCLLFCSPRLTVYAQEDPSLYATGAVLMDADTGRILYGKNSDAFLANASTTKILTCIVALENASLDDLVEVSAYAASMPKVKLYMKQGEHFKLKDLLHSLMLESHNDSAVAIAEHVGGSMEGFAVMMNAKAREIGCKNSWFITPNGLDATQNYTDTDGNSMQLSHGTCAEDLARIMAYCTFYSDQSELFLKITRTPSYSFLSSEGRSFSCVNHNAFLNMMEGAISGKTGFTSKAGYCYVGALERDGKRFTIALLACGWPNNKTYKWKDSRVLFTYGLENYEYHRLDEVAFDRKILDPILVENAQTDYMDQSCFVQLGIREGCGTQDSNDHTDYHADEGSLKGLLLSKDEKIEVHQEVARKLKAPVEQGTVVGCIRYMLGDTCLRSDEIITMQAATEIDFSWCFQKVMERFLLY